MILRSPHLMCSTLELFLYILDLIAKEFKKRCRKELLDILLKLARENRAGKLEISVSSWNRRMKEAKERKLYFNKVQTIIYSLEDKVGT